MLYLFTIAILTVILFIGHFSILTHKVTKGHSILFAKPSALYGNNPALNMLQCSHKMDVAPSKVNETLYGVFGFDGDIGNHSRRDDTDNSCRVNL